ncbi:MAG: o-succinylbenzoate synthase [Flavobacteriaceae bacterium]
MQARFIKYRLDFKQPSGTSRGVLTCKDSWFIILEKEGKKGIGECSILKGLSYDDRPDFEAQLTRLCKAINNQTILPNLTQWPALRMGYEMALLSLEGQSTYNLFPSNFTKGTTSIPINGLVWMGSHDFMRKQIDHLLEREFDCIKIKIGAIHFEKELDLIARIRKQYNSNAITIRVDANGAFAPQEALEKLKRLSDFSIHSIEQPIATEQWESLASLCEKTPVPIALDEELIGLFSSSEKVELLNTVMPQYLIIKPSLLGGFKQSEEWMRLAEERKILWWTTSALESNIGLNAIAQWTFRQKIQMPQGLGTGSLFDNNIDSPLIIKKGCLWVDNSIPWGLINK